jgi:hypothetical protein
MNTRRIASTFLHRIAVGLCCLAAIAVAGVDLASAQDDRATVRIDGRAVFRVGPTEELDSSDRARRIERRVATLLETPDAIVTGLRESGLPLPEPSLRVVLDGSNLTRTDARSHAGRSVETPRSMEP